MLIYKATNLTNNKCYVGLTIVTLEERKIDHYKEAFNKNNKRYFYNAIRKYGWDNFKWEILEDNITELQTLKDRETFNIIKHDAYYHNDSWIYQHGYNLTLGGDGCSGYKHSKEAKLKFSGINNPNYKKQFTEEEIKKMSDAQIKRFKENMVTEKTKNKLSEKSIIAWKKRKINGTDKNSEEANQKNRLSHLGKVVSEETKRKMKEAHSKRHEKLRNEGKHINNGLTGHKHTEETKRKMKESNKIAWIERRKKLI